MKRRWFIRCLFMVPIVLCVVGWGWSVKHGFGALYASRGDAIFCESIWGGIQLGWARFDQLIPADGIHISFPSVYEAHIMLAGNFWGFALQRQSYTDALDSPALTIPYWFLLLLFSGLLFFVWRKTRPRINPATAFPVEIDAK